MRHDDIAGDEVAAFLRANPGFLAANPDIYRVLDPPQRLHGEDLADHMAAMLQRERAHAQLQAARAESVLAAGRAAAGLGARVQDAVLALIGTTDVLDAVPAELPGLLGVDSATICTEQPGARTRTIPAGTANRLLARREVVFRDTPHDPALLHGAAAPLARVDALVRLGPGCLLALASRERSRLHPGQGTAPLAFLGRAVAAAMGR